MAQLTCPVCNGTKEVPTPDNLKQYAFWKDSTHIPCSNCGGQYMGNKGTGLVNADKDGNPCTHKYVTHTIGNCLHESICTKCTDIFVIDSGD